MKASEFGIIEKFVRKSIGGKIIYYNGYELGVRFKNKGKQHIIKVSARNVAPFLIINQIVRKVTDIKLGEDYDKSY